MAPHSPLRNPKDYFRRHDRPSLGVGTAVVAAQALVSIVIVWLFIQQVLAHVGLSLAANPDAESVMRNQFIAVIVLSFVGWILFALVLHVFVWFSDADGGFGTTLAVVGEAELVGIVLLPVTAIVLFTSVGSLPQEPGAAVAAIESATGLQSPLLVVSSLVGTIWKAIIAGYGLLEAHGIPAETAFPLTFVVGFVTFLLSLVP